MKPSYESAVVLPQVEAFVATRMSTLCRTMKRMEKQAEPDTRVLLYIWHLTGKRPRVRNSQHFVNMMKVSLRMQLSERGFVIRDIMGVVGRMDFHIEWYIAHPSHE